MDTELMQFKADEIKKANEWIVPNRIDVRIGYLFSLIATWIGFGMFGFDRFGPAEWQNGEFSTYVGLSFAESVWVLYVPFLIYSTGCMLLLLWDADRFFRRWIVRFGIYTGLILASQFSLQVIFSAEMGIAFFFGAIALIPVILAYLGGKAFIRFVWRNRDDQRVLILTAVLVVALLIGLVFSIGVIAVGILCAGVFACPLIAALTSYRLWVVVDQPLGQQTFAKLVSYVGWGITWGSVSYIAINRIFELYTQLPENPPDCYVATASAKGHVGLVGSRPVKLANGTVIQVSRQLQILKAGELVLSTIAPKLHQLIRFIYDWIGPNLAKRIHQPWLADVGYIMFKPFEFVTLVLLRWLLPSQLNNVFRFYLGDEN